jgi:hypothetical protein
VVGISDGWDQAVRFHFSILPRAIVSMVDLKTVGTVLSEQEHRRDYRRGLGTWVEAMGTAHVSGMMSE